MIAVVAGLVPGNLSEDSDGGAGVDETLEEVERERRANRARGRVVEDNTEGVLDAIADGKIGAGPGAGDGAISQADEFASDEDSIEEQPVEFLPLPDRRRQLDELLQAAGVMDVAPSMPLAIEIESIATCNSDSVTPGSLYVCVPDSEDPEIDGHDWVAEAVEAGAVAVVADGPLAVDCPVPVIQVPNSLEALASLAEEFYETPAQRIRTIGVVGSRGKSSVAWLVRGLLEQAGELVGMIGDSEYAISTVRVTREGEIWEPDEEDPNQDRPRSYPFAIAEYSGKYELPSTTPDVLHLNKLLASFADRQATSAVVEICPTSAMDGRIKRLRPEVLVFTNIDPEVAAMDPEGPDAYAERISAMFEGLNENQVAVINVDDPLGPLLMRLAEASGAQVLTYGLTNRSADVTADKVKPSVWESEILVHIPNGRLDIVMYMIGTHVVSNVLAAVGVGVARGVRLVNIVSGIESVDVIPGRNELIDEKQSFPVIVDSVATPAALGRLIDEVKEAGARKTILVVGCSGDTTPEHRAAIGRMAHYKSDVVIFTNDSPGLSYPDTIIADIVAGMPQEILGRHAGAYYPWLQDSHRTPQWYQPWAVRYQSEVGRYIIEDRATAIRVAVGLAKPRDVVLVTGRGDSDKMEYWDGIPPPRSEEERAASIAAAQKEGPGSKAWEEEHLRWSHIDAYWESCQEAGEPIQQKTVAGWFSDRVECRNAVYMLNEKLNKSNLKDLDRSTLPWTRYPEERDMLGLAESVTMSAAEGTGGLDLYLRSVGDEIKDSEVAREREVVDGDEDFDAEEDEEESDEDDGFFP